MTKDEIKSQYSMTDIVVRYGFRPDRSGFIRCPFHLGDKNASLKIYKDSFFCFGCHESGDIFKFVMLMDNVSFKDAFVSLGGTYEKPETKKDAIRIKHNLVLAKREREKYDRELQGKKEQMNALGKYLTTLVVAEKRLEPLSETWGQVVKELTVTYAQWLELWEEVNENGGFRH